MSRAAAEYYQERAARLDINTLPGILDGTPVRLLEGDYEQRLSLQRPDTDRLAMVTQRYSQIVHSLDEFLFAGIKANWTDLPRGESDRSNEVNQRHIDTLVTGKLFPKGIQAGHLRDIQTEAIARSEIQPSHISKAGESSGYYYDEEAEPHEVYLRTSGALYVGKKRLGYAACLSIISLDCTPTPNSGLAVTPRYLGLDFNKNDLLAKSAVEESRAITTYIAAWGLQNQLVQNTRRSGKQHGKRNA